MRKTNTKQDLILGLTALITTAVTIYMHRLRISDGLDKVFINLLGKSFSQRGTAVQVISYLGLALLFLSLLLLLLRNLSARTNENKFIRILIPVLLLSSLVFLFIICQEQTIRRDDYWEIHDAQDLGMVSFIKYEFSNFSGRYFSWFLRSLYSIFPPETYIHHILCINLLTLLFGMLLLSSLFLEKLCVELPVREKRLLSIVMGMCGMSAILFMSTNIWEVWFWGGGTFGYGVGIALSILSQTLILKVSFDESCGKGWYIVCAVCITLCCGTSELIVVSMALFSFFIALVAKLCNSNKHWNKNSLWCWFWTWACASFSLFSPGNFRNSQGYTGLTDPGITELVAFLANKLWESMQEVMHNLIWYSYSRLEYILIFLAVFFVLGTLVQIKGETKKYFFFSSAILLVTAVISLMINAYVGYMPARVISIPVGWIFLALALLCFLAGSQCVSSKNETSFSPTLGLCSLISFLVIGWFYCENIGLVRSIREGWNYRDAILRADESGFWTVETCSIPVLGSKSMDLSNDPYYEFNTVTAQYYGFPEIAADEYCPPFN